ncbi:MAG: squalene/phytoene synthase family protein [Pararhodobacter sp.]
MGLAARGRAGYVAGMDHAAALSACADRVERGDPDRFLATMAAPPEARGALFALQAFNLELARAPWASKEPLIARMRLQYWRDVLEGENADAHEIAPPLLALVAGNRVDRALLMRMIDAREAEIGTRAPFADEAALWAYLKDGAGALMAASVMALGGPPSAAAEALGAAQGLANYVVAIPALEAAGRQPLPDGRPEALVRLAEDGLNRLTEARRALRSLPRGARPALLAAWRAKSLLEQVRRDPARVAAGTLGHSEFRRRGSLLWSVLSGRI